MARFLALLVALNLVASASAQVRSPEESLVVLKNGQVFRGKVTWAGDTYQVESPGRRLTFQRSNVLVVARDLADAYAQRRAALRPTDWQGHQELAAWCLSNQMFEEAARELDDADTTSPGHPMTSRLRTNLAILRQRAAASPKSEPAAPPPPSTRRDTTLDELIDTLPDGAVSAFTKSIQPILVNGCAAAACHGVSSKSDWRLLRIDTRQAASRYATLRNLEATLKLIDREQPERSPLLTVPKAPHATAKEAVFNTRNLAQVEQLEAWVNRVSGRPSAQARIDKATRTAPPDRGTTSAESLPADPFNPDEFNNSPASRRVTNGGPSKTPPN